MIFILNVLKFVCSIGFFISLFLGNFEEACFFYLFGTTFVMTLVNGEMFSHYDSKIKELENKFLEQQKNFENRFRG